jgi:hypothetical protein
LVKHAHFALIPRRSSFTASDKSITVSTKDIVHSSLTLNRSTVKSDGAKGFQ